MPLPPPPGFEHVNNRSIYNRADFFTYQNHCIVMPSVKMERGEGSKARESGRVTGSRSGWEFSKVKKRKKPNFNRFFSETDEIALLYGLIQYANKIKSNPFADLPGLLKFITPWLRVNPSEYQLQTKISKFRTKFLYNKRRNLDPDARRLKPHERRAFEVSKRVWDNQYIKTERFRRSLEAALKKGPPKKRAKKGKAVKEVPVEAETAAMKNENAVKVVVVVEDHDQQWRELAMAQLRLTHKKALLLSNQTRLILDALADY